MAASWLHLDIFLAFARPLIGLCILYI
eukprot:COSAG05_NODE_2360_length_3182_cov_15.581901_1_plen_26_part_10